MPYRVLLTDSAARDIEELDAYIAQNDSVIRAEYVLTKIEEIIRTLSEFPERGVYPQELSALGIREYREVFFKPYRIIYRVIKNAVYIYLIMDGRRDMQTLLSRRLLNK
jgi:toxin ParE1/3/4